MCTYNLWFLKTKNKKRLEQKKTRTKNEVGLIMAYNVSKCKKESDFFFFNKQENNAIQSLMDTKTCFTFK